MTVIIGLAPLRTTTFSLLLCVLAPSPPAAQAPEHTRAIDHPAIVGLDHIPIAVNDLEAAAMRFRKLGFVLKAGRPHANGIRNEHAKFPDGTELELITASEARDDLTTTYRRHLVEGDGPAFLAFYAPDAERVMAPRPRYIFLGGRQHSPTDRPEHFAHPNGAVSFIRVWLAADDFSSERRLLESAGGKLLKEKVFVPEPTMADLVRLAEGDVVFLPGSRQLVKGRPIIGATVQVKNVAATRRVIESAGIAVRDVPETASIFVAPDAANGLWLEFRTISGRIRRAMIDPRAHEDSRRPLARSHSSRHSARPTRQSD